MTVDGTAKGDADVAELQPPPAERQVSDDEAPEWKSYVERRNDAAPDYPTISKFQKDDTVWIVKPTVRGATGPCTIVEVLGSETYRVRDTGTGNEWTESGEHMKYRI